MGQVRSLGAVLARMESLVVNDADVACRERGMRAIEAEQACDERRDRLAAESIALDPGTLRAVIDGRGLLQGGSLQAVKVWLEQESARPVLVLSGGTGCGKSVAAAWAVANSRYGGHWRSAAAVTRTFAAQFGDAVDEQETLRECYLLVVDDVGAEHDANRMSAALVELLEQRKRSPKRTRTIFTTNLSKANWCKRYPDERLRSRLAAYSQWVSDTGEDLRRRKL